MPKIRTLLTDKAICNKTFENPKPFFFSAEQDSGNPNNPIDLSSLPANITTASICFYGSGATVDGNNVILSPDGNFSMVFNGSSCYPLDLSTISIVLSETSKLVIFGEYTPEIT